MPPDPRLRCCVKEMFNDFPLLGEELDKQLFDEIVTGGRNAYKEIITKHKKALRLKNELQLADREFCRMH